MTKHLTLLVIATLCAIALYAVVGVRLANAAAGDIFNLGTLGGTSSAGYDINDAGQVVGSAQDAVGRSRAFLWESSRGITDLGTTNGYTEAHAHAISTSGSVVGVEYENVTGVTHAFAWTPNEPNGTTGTMTSLARDDNSTAADINAASQVVGSSTNVYFVDDGSCTPDHPYYPNCGPGGAWYYETRAVLWQNGVGADVTSPSFTLETANAINNAGQVAGQTAAAHAFRYDGTPGSGGVLHDLGTLGGTMSVGIAINDAGQVVGDSWTIGDTGQHAFRYSGTPGSGGVMVDLGALGGTSSHAYDINDAGLVVGVADRAAGAGGGSWATLWQNDAGNTSIDLDAWIDATNPTLGGYWKLTVALAINNNGLITGIGIYDDGTGGMSDGYRAFVLDASSLVPEPTNPGDFNLDGAVDGSDLANWKAGFGTSVSATHTQGDADGDLDVDGGDFLVWQRQVGSGAPAMTSSAPVPEPLTSMLFQMGYAGLVILARRGVAHDKAFAVP